MEVFMVVNYINSHYPKPIDSNAVIHGHAGSGDKLIYADRAPYIRITDENEHVVSTDFSIGETRSIKIYFVIKDASETSATPTMIEFAGDVAAEFDQWAPYLMRAYINKAGDKISLHFDEMLDIGSVPQPTDFSLSGASVTSVVYSVYNVQSVNIYNNSLYGGVSKVELALSEPISDVSDLKISYDGTALRDIATVPNEVKPIDSEPVYTAGLSVDSVDVSYNGQYISVKVNNSVYMEESKTLNVILKYGADASTASTLIEGTDYIKDWSSYADGSRMSINLKLVNEPVLTEGHKYFIIIDANGMKDYAGDDIPVIEAIGVPEKMPENEIIPEAVYNSDENEIVLTFPEDISLESSTLAACFFTLTVDGCDYILRDYTYYDIYYRAIRLTQDNIPLAMDSVDRQNAKISYSMAAHPGAGAWDYLILSSGMPYQGFTDVSITVQQ